jgi:hypothetical protein
VVMIMSESRATYQVWQCRCCGVLGIADSEKGRGGKGKMSIQHDSERKDKRKITLERNRLH